MTDQNAQIIALLTKISNQLDAIAAGNAPESPNYQRPLSAFADFDWSSINASVTARDTSGAAIVLWAGHQWQRRTGAGKFGDAIWFSRPTGQSEQGVQYARLITFKDRSQPEPVTVPAAAANSKNVLQRGPNAPAAAAQKTAPAGNPAKRAAAPAGNSNGSAHAAASALFSYAYPNGGQAVKQMERAAFDSYRRAHGEQPPASVDALRAWYRQRN